MDFFGIIYDIKNGKKVPYSKTYFDTLFAAKLGGSDVKTLTGALPLTFSTSEDKLRDWTICGNNYEHTYSATGTLPLTVATHTAGAASDWVIYGNDEQGENLFDIPNITITGNNNYYAGYSFSGTLATTILAEFNANIGSQYSWYINIDTEYTGNVFFILVLFYADGTYGSFINPHKFTPAKEVARVEIRAEYDSENGKGYQYTFSDITLVKGSNPPDHYIPYQQGVGEKRVDGYYVPLTVSQTGQTDKKYDIYIGDRPLTEGETVSKTSTGIDVELFEGENTVGTTLYNKPSMSIEGVDYVGVGEPTNDGWQIPLTVSHITDNIFDKDAKNTNKGYEDSTCLMWGGSLTNPYLTGNEDNNCFVSEKIPVSPNTTYYLTDGIFKNTDNGIYSVFLWNRQRMSDYQAFPTEKTFTTGDDTKFIQLCVLKAYADTVMITTKPTETYIPHVEVNNVNVPIDAPLTASDIATKASTGVDIPTYVGTNTINTTLENKPEMTITYKE